MLPGVKNVVSGYAGGKELNPTYEQVCAHATHHAEVIKIDFDPAQVSVKRLVDYFWHVHNPTQVGGQGNDHGPQYRSIILYANAEQKAAAEKSKAEASKVFRDPITTEIVPLEKLKVDEHPRFDVDLGSMAKLPPVFRKNGSVHAGNSSGVTDGASSMLVAGGAAVKRHGMTPMARIVGYAQAGVDPKIMGIGPVPATRKLLTDTGIALDEVDLIELNEAFAAQVLACERELHFDRAKLNVNGGAIALGHPIGATGTRIVTTLVHAMRARSARLGLATLCISGGMGLSLLVEAC